MGKQPLQKRNTEPGIPRDRDLCNVTEELRPPRRSGARLCTCPSARWTSEGEKGKLLGLLLTVGGRAGGPQQGCGIGSVGGGGQTQPPPWLWGNSGKGFLGSVCGVPPAGRAWNAHQLTLSTDIVQLAPQGDTGQQGLEWFISSTPKCMARKKWQPWLLKLLGLEGKPRQGLRRVPGLGDRK